MTETTDRSSKNESNSQAFLDEQEIRDRMARIGRKLLVLSGKGGVGKSTVAANLAVALAEKGKTVGLLDIDLHGPSIPNLLGLEGKILEIEAGRILPATTIDNVKVVSIGFFLPGGSDPVIWRGPRKAGLIRQFLKDVAWGELDYLVVDSPPGTGDEPLSVAQLIGQPAGAVIVTTPQDVAIADVRRCVSFCRTMSLPIIGIVENMRGFVCPDCGRKIDVFKSGGGERLSREENIDFLGSIPIDVAISVAGDDGVPFTKDKHASSNAFRTIVDRILAGEPEQKQIERSDGSMKIAIPLAGGRLCMHFGHCEQFALVDVDEKEKTILGKTLETPPMHEPGVLPKWLHELGVDAVIAGGMGQRAQQLFAENNIQVIVGASAGTPEELASEYLEGTLQLGDNVCDH